MGKRLVDKRNRFGIRKLSVGVCSVVVATCFLGATTSYAEEQAENSEPREERVEISNTGDQGKEEKTVNEHQEESEQPSATTSEKENRTVSQGTLRTTSKQGSDAIPPRRTGSFHPLWDEYLLRS